MLPLECQYLNKSALTTLVGPLTPPVKHFQLKRKPKSATLRAELLQKCMSLDIRKGPLQLKVYPNLDLCVICRCRCSHRDCPAAQKDSRSAFPRQRQRTGQKDGHYQ